MKRTRTFALSALAIIGVTIGAVVSLGGGKLFETGGDGGWFSGLLNSPTINKTAQPGADTRLAEQRGDTPIEDPVRGQEDLDSALARMAGLPYVTAEDALSGALIGDAAGMARLQAYLDAAGFDPEALETRSAALFGALEADRDLAYTREETRNAARRIVSSARLTAQSAFLYPAVVFHDFRLNEALSGWDLGPYKKDPFANFERVSDQGIMVRGDRLAFFEDASQATLLTDGATDFRAVRLPTRLDGPLRVYALAATQRAQGGPYPLPFGYSVSASGQPYRIVDGRKAKGAPWVSLEQSAIAVHTGTTTPNAAQSSAEGALSDEGQTTPLDADNGRATQEPVMASASIKVGEISNQAGLSFAQASASPASSAGAVLSLPVTASNGAVRLAIDQLRRQTTLASGFVLGDDPMPPAIARIAERARQLESTDALVAGLTGQSANPSSPRTPRSAPAEPTGFLAVGTVDFPTALAGALSGSTQGNRDLASYLDAAGGDLQRLEKRALALVDGLEARAQFDDFLTLAEAANRITDATAKAASTTYLMNGFIGRDFDLPNPEAGWDFGAPDAAPHSGFERTSSGSPIVIGQNTRHGSNAERTPLVKDFLTRIEGLRFELPSAYYRVLMLVGPTPGTAGPSPLGQTITINGTDQRLRDLRLSSPQVWSRLAGGTITLHGGLESYGPVDPRLEKLLDVSDANNLAPLKALFMRGGVYSKLPPTGQDVDPNSTLSRGQRNAMVYAARAFVNASGGMIIDFPSPPQGGTVLGALIQGESDPEALADRLAERIAQLLGSTAPAAGVVLEDVLPASGSIFAAAFNAPTQLAANTAGQAGTSNNGGGLSPVGGGGLVAPTDAGTTDTGTTDTGTTDTGTTDTGTTDTGTTDTGTTDTGTTDTGTTDTGTTDTGTTDTGTTDTGTTDTGTTDTGTTDTGTTDTGTTDTGTTDTGTTDTGTTDTGTTDTGTTDTGTTDTGTTDTGTTDTGTTDTGTTDTGTTDTGTTDTGTTDTGTTDTGTTDTGTTDTGTTDTGTTDTGTTDTGTTDTGTTDTGTTDTGTTDTGTTDTGTTDTGTTDTGTTDTGTTDTGTTDTGTTDSGTTDTGTTDTGTTDTGTTDTGTTDTGTTDTGTTDTGTTDTGTTDTGTTDTGTTDTGTTDTGTTDTGTTDTGTTDTGTTDTGTTDTGTTDTGTTDTGTTDTGTTDTGTTDTGTTEAGTTDGGTLILTPDAGGPYRVNVDEEFAFDGSGSVFNIALDTFDIEWILRDAGGVEVLRVTGLGVPGSPQNPSPISLSEIGEYEVSLVFTFGQLIERDTGLVIVVAGNEIPAPRAILLLLPGLLSLLILRRRRA